MTATEFLDEYGESLHHSTILGAIADRPRFRERLRDYRRIRSELHERGISDDDIAGQIVKIMAAIVAHLGDYAAILALVLPLFLTPAPTTAVA